MPWQPIDLNAEDRHAPEFRGDPADLFDAAAELLALLTPPRWHQQAACRGEPTSTFFPGRGHTAAKARTICAGCPVQPECLADAMADPHRDGTWGGTTMREREAIRRAARTPEAAA